VPDWRFTVQVKGLAVSDVEMVSMAGAVTSPPGMMAKMKGDVPPTQVIAAG